MFDTWYSVRSVDGTPRRVLEEDGEQRCATRQLTVGKDRKVDEG